MMNIRLGQVSRRCYADAATNECIYRLRLFAFVGIIRQASRRASHLREPAGTQQARVARAMARHAAATLYLLGRHRASR